MWRLSALGMSPATLAEYIEAATRIPADLQATAPGRHCQTKFYTAGWRFGVGWSPTVFAHESPTRSARFDAENGQY